MLKLELIFNRMKTEMFKFCGWKNSGVDAKIGIDI
jgi:hypothetical protein